MGNRKKGFFQKLGNIDHTVTYLLLVLWSVRLRDSLSESKNAFVSLTKAIKASFRILPQFSPNQITNRIVILGLKTIDFFNGLISPSSRKTRHGLTYVF